MSLILIVSKLYAPLYRNRLLFPVNEGRKSFCAKTRISLKRKRVYCTQLTYRTNYNNQKYSLITDNISLRFEIFQWIVSIVLYIMCVYIKHTSRLEVECILVKVPSLMKRRWGATRSYQSINTYLNFSSLRMLCVHIKNVKERKKKRERECVCVCVNKNTIYFRMIIKSVFDFHYFVDSFEFMNALIDLFYHLHKSLHLSIFKNDFIHCSHFSLNELNIYIHTTHKLFLLCVL
jgi:hypothetical protein